MPEILEVESYRRAAARVVGRRVVEVVAPDSWYLKGGLVAEELGELLVGEAVSGTGRRGKLAWLVVGDHRLGLRFGMTGRIVVDGDAPIDQLLYSSARVAPAWERFGLRFEDGGTLVMVDPRRLGGVELDPDLARLGADAIDHRWTPAALRDAVAGERALKAALLDQSRIAGLGNLLVDELSWRAGLDPGRSGASLVPPEWRRLAHHLPRLLSELAARGGSHTGDLQPARTRGGWCPRDGTPLRRDTIGGRTTYWCPRHQR